MKSFFKHLVDSSVVFIAEKYGFGTEEDVHKKEVRDLQYQYMLEKAKNLDDSIEEIKELKNEVKKLTDDKIRMLEREVQRLEYENQRYKQLEYKETFSLEQSTFPFAHIDRFVYKDGYIKYVLKNGLTNIVQLKEEDMIKYLNEQFSNVVIRLEDNHLRVSYTTHGLHKSQSFNLNEFISMSSLEKINHMNTYIND